MSSFLHLNLLHPLHFFNSRITSSNLHLHRSHTKFSTLSLLHHIKPCTKTGRNWRRGESVTHGGEWYNRGRKEKEEAITVELCPELKQGDHRDGSSFPNRTVRLCDSGRYRGKHEEDYEALLKSEVQSKDDDADPKRVFLVALNRSG